MTEETTAVATNDKAADTAFDLAASAAFYREHSAVQKNGVRVVKAEDFHNRLADQHGISMADLKKFQDALKDERSAVALVAGEDLEEKIKTGRTEGKSIDDLRGLSATVRLPLLGMEEDITVLAAETTKIGKKAGDEGPTERTDYGVVTTNITRHMSMRKPVVESLASRLARAMGVDQ